MWNPNSIFETDIELINEACDRLNLPIFDTLVSNYWKGMNKADHLTLWMQDTTFLSNLANYFTTYAPNNTRLEEFFQWMVVYSTGMGYSDAYNYLFEQYYLPNSSEEEQNDPSAALLNFNPYHTYFVLYRAQNDLFNALNEGEAMHQMLDSYIENNFSYLWSIMANATNWPTWGGNFLSTLHSDLLLTIWANYPEVCQNIHQNLDITFLNSLILKHASPHAMTQATGSSFFTQAMALATANTASTALPELIAFMGNRLGQTRANQLLAKVGHLLTLEQQYTLQETYLYGSSRLGVKNQQLNLSTRVASVQNGSLTPIGNAILNTDSVFTGTASAYNLPKAPSSRVFYRTWGLKQYELSNHLGNVQVTISDKKLGVVGANQVDFVAYEPEVKSATDYYAYGMEMPGKTYQSTANRYGMNTQEKDNEIYGPGNTLGALYWEYDARIARRWNVDPLYFKYPSTSPYSTFNSNPLYFNDKNGNEGVAVVDHKNTTITIKAVYFVEVGKGGVSSELYAQLLGLNTILNSNNYKVTDEKNTLHGYSIQFELKFLPAPVEQLATNLAVSEKELHQSGENYETQLLVEGFTIANSLIVMDDKKFMELESIKEVAKKHSVSPSKVLGATSTNLEHIALPSKSRGNLMTTLHEIFHTLYLDKDGENSGVGSGKSMPNSQDINDLMNQFQSNNRILTK